jgi:hypothetical protein
MFGQWPFIGVPGVCEGVGALLAGAGVVGVAGVVLVGAAAAPAIPAAAPPTASVPETIATLSIFEMCIGLEPPVMAAELLCTGVVLCTIMRAQPKRARRSLVGAV